MMGAEGTLLAIAAGNAYGATRAAVSAGVSSRPTISRSNVLTYASTLAVTDEVNARSIAPITCSGSLALDLAAVGGRQVDEVVRLQEFLVAGALRVAPDRKAQPRPRRQVQAKAEPRRRNRLSREAAAIDPQARFEEHTGARLVAILEPDRGTCGVSGRTQEQWQSLRSARLVGPGSPVTANRIALERSTVMSAPTVHPHPVRSACTSNPVSNRWRLPAWTLNSWRSETSRTLRSRVKSTTSMPNTSRMLLAQSHVFDTLAFIEPLSVHAHRIVVAIPGRHRARRRARAERRRIGQGGDVVARRFVNRDGELVLFVLWQAIVPARRVRALTTAQHKQRQPMSRFGIPDALRLHVLKARKIHGSRCARR